MQTTKMQFKGIPTKTSSENTFRQVEPWRESRVLRLGASASLRMTVLGEFPGSGAICYIDEFAREQR